MQNGPLSRRERKRLVQREEYISAANRLFGEKGFENTLVEEISEAVDMGTGSFYYYFSSKEDLAANILLREIEKLKKVMQEVYEEGLPLRESLEKCAMIYLDFHERYGAYLEIVNTVWQGHKKAVIDKDIMETIYRDLWKCVGVMEAIFEKYRFQDRWKGINLKAVAVACWTFLLGSGHYKNQLTTTNPEYNLNDVLMAILDMILKKE